MKTLMQLFVAIALALRLAHADGGAVCLHEGSGAFLVTVFVAPQPVQSGAIDTSVLVQDRKSGAVILDAKVDLAFRRSDAAGPELLTHATREHSTNKVLQSSRAILPAPGSWELRVFVSRGSDHADVATVLPVSPAAPRLAVLWPLLLFPPVAVALFALHQTLRIRTGRPFTG